MIQSTFNKTVKGLPMVFTKVTCDNCQKAFNASEVAMKTMSNLFQDKQYCNNCAADKKPSKF